MKTLTPVFSRGAGEREREALLKPLSRLGQSEGSGLKARKGEGWP
jgi:hypothetical protein